MAANVRWRELATELAADLEYYRNGHIQVTEDATDVPVLAAGVAAQRAAGLEIELIGGDELRRLAPGLGPGVIAGAYTAGDGHANPGQTARAFAAAANRHGAQVRTQTNVSGMTLTGDRVSGVRTDQGDFGADWVVLAAGAWSSGLLRGLGVDLPLVPTGLQMILTTARPPFLSQVITARRRPLSLKQVRGGGYLIGGGWPGDVELNRPRGTIRPESIAGSRAAASAIFPTTTATEITASWVGIEAVTPDEVPILGPLPGIANLTLAAGFSGHGFALSPTIGQVIAELIIDGQPSVPIDNFAAARFAGWEGAARLPTPHAG
jgi:sarcosine oxidase subunit beta